jgi:hypothetical protein
LSSLKVIYCRDRNNNTIGDTCKHCPLKSFQSVDNLPLNSYGWNICYDDSGNFPYFGYSFYRMTNSYTNDFFYLDFRDCNYAPSGEYGYLWTDLSIYLNLNYDGNGHSRYECKVQSNPSVAINNGEVIRIWEIEYLSPPQPYVPKTDCFPDYWQNCLVLIPTSDNHPRLVWGPYPERKQGGCSLFC